MSRLRGEALMCMEPAHSLVTTKITKVEKLARIKGDYTLLLSNFVLDTTFKRIH